MVGAGWTVSGAGRPGSAAQSISGLFGSASIIATVKPRSANPSASSRAAVVFPAPPFGLMKAIVRKGELVRLQLPPTRLLHAAAGKRQHVRRDSFLSAHGQGRPRSVRGAHWTGGAPA